MDRIVAQRRLPAEASGPVDGTPYTWQVETLPPPEGFGDLNPKSAQIQLIRLRISWPGNQGQRSVAIERLVALSGRLGADVPFLTQDVATLALGWGRGDRLLALPTLPERRVMLFVFGHGIPTKDAYAWLARTPPEPRGDDNYKARHAARL